MKTRIAALLGLVALLATQATATEFKSKAEEISLTGRVQVQWSHSTVDGDPSNEFLIRRARATLKIKINDWWSGVLQPDFAGGELSLKDAYVKLKPHDNFSLTMGQFKRRFDLFELTSSTRILVIERDGHIGRQKIPSLSRFTEANEYADRDIGAFVSAHDSKKIFSLDAGITNGAGSDTKAEVSEKAYQGRLTLRPLEALPLRIMGGVSLRPYESEFAGTDSAGVDYASAFEGSVEWGTFEAGIHLQAGFVIGDNVKGVELSEATTFDITDPPSFFAFQGILTYKHPLADNTWFESFEPVVRVGYGDPDTDVGDNGGLLITPGINVFTKTRNRLSVNADIFTPRADGADTEVGVKIQSWLYW
ncbi:MAG: porin [Candidatus Krumholzibacteriia bacterium]